MRERERLPERTDVLVVGGGVMGASTAFFLTTETDLDVTLVEKDRIAAGSTGDSSAILRHHYGDQAIYSELAWWSHAFYRRFDEETGASISYAENPLVRFGSEGTQSGAYAESGYDVLAGLDVPVKRYDGDELPDRFPMIETVEDYDFAVSDVEAAYSDGTDAASGFARAAHRNGATVVTGVGAGSIVSEDGRVVGVETDDGRIACEAVVIAAGPWTPRLAETVGVDLPITVTREQVLVLDPPESFSGEYPESVPTTALPGGEWYIRPDFGGGILVGTHHTGEVVDPDDYENVPDEETILELIDTLGEMIPALRDSGIRGRYCGVYASTPDHDFLLDEVGPDGCYVACGFSGHGFKHAPAIGKTMTDLIVDGEASIVGADYFSFDRFETDPNGHGQPADNI